MWDDVLAVFTKRRSVRRFTGQPVGRDRLEIALRAAMAAPSGNNARPWQFVVVTGKEKVAELCRAHPYATFGINAGAVVIPFGSKGSTRWFDQDMAAATQNLLVALANLGLGATWCGMDDERQDSIRRILGIPSDQYAFAIVPVGVPAEEKPPRTQYEETRVFWERVG